jgi:hypothetical protein
LFFSDLVDRKLLFERNVIFGGHAAAIPFTDRELKRAWRELTACAQVAVGVERQNPQRLLLFYAVEVGLKAVFLKRKNRSLFDSADIAKMGHDLRQILRDLGVGTNLQLPEILELETVAKRGKNLLRNGDVSILHQAWRYGGKCVSPTDKDCEEKLEKVLIWIRGELR